MKNLRIKSLNFSLVVIQTVGTGTNGSTVGSYNCDARVVAMIPAVSVGDHFDIYIGSSNDNSENGANINLAIFFIP